MENNRLHIPNKTNYHDTTSGIGAADFRVSNADRAEISGYVYQEFKGDDSEWRTILPVAEPNPLRSIWRTIVSVTEVLRGLFN